MARVVVRRSHGFERLLTEVRACAHCEAQLPLGPRPVPQAHPDARVLITGQAPGRALVLPHPSPCNNGWLARHPKFVRRLLPTLRQRVGEVLDSR
jgi:uracil-DNA glycosylase